MTVSIAVPRRESTHFTIGLPAIYSLSLAGWLLTRLLVLVHQGAWPWMNAFVVAAARGMVDEATAMWETVYAIRRAGADIILSYFAPTLAESL